MEKKTLRLSSVFENNTTLNGYELLSIAIICQAAEDYRTALKSQNTHDALVLERFFRSEWGDLLSFGMGEIILEKLQKGDK